MLPHPTLDKLQTLRLHGMLKALNEQLKTPDIDSLSFEERLGLLVDRELTERDDKRLSSRLRQARLKHNACLEDIDYRAPRGLDKGLILQLGSGQWLRDGLNLIINGPTGVGKTWLACALAHQACREGYSVRYLRLPRLLEELGLAHGDGRFAKLMSSYAKTDLLILDDWGLAPFTVEQRRDMLERLNRRPLRPALDHRHQPDAGGQLARTDRRSDPGRCHPRPPGAQRLPDQPQGRIDEKAGEEIDGAGHLRLTMLLPLTEN